MTPKLHCRKLKKKFRGFFHSQSRDPPAQTSPLETALPTTPAEKPPNSQEQDLEAIHDKTFSPWERAERKLNEDPEKKRLLRTVQEILGSELGSELQPIGAAGRQKQLSDLFVRKTGQLEREKWRVQFGDHEIVIQELVSKVFEGVLMVKEIVNSAASASPPAAMACAGLSVVFTLALQATHQDAVLLQTLDHTAGLIARFRVMEDLCGSDLDSSNSRPLHHRDLVGKFEDHLTELYTAILEFQFRALCNLQKHSLLRILGNAFDHEGWTGILQGIKDLESSAERDAQTIGAANVEGRLKEIQDDQKNNWARQIMLERDEAVQKLLQSLRKHTCPYKARKDRNNDRVPGTCEWFTNHRLFQGWHKCEGSRLLWVSADPGCGKSVLAKYIVDDLLPATKESAICYFFFKVDYPDQRTATSAVCALLHQIFLAQPHLLRDSTLKRLNAVRQDLTESFKDLWSIFTSVVADPSAGSIICVLDAIDECDDGRAYLIKAATRLQLGASGNGNVKFLVTSRPYDNILQEFRDIQGDLSTIHLSGEGEEEVEQIGKEIHLVVRKRIEDIWRRRALKPEQCELLLSGLTSIPNKTYLWVSLTMDVISSTPGLTKGNIREVINQIPPSVYEAYEKILNRTPAPARARTILQAIVSATRPLSVGEMSMIMAIHQARQSSAEIEDYLEPEEDFRRSLREICGLFVVVVHSHVYLLHQTARAFLLRTESRLPFDDVSSTATWKGSISLKNSNRTLADVCTWCRASGRSGSLNTLFEYASGNWTIHFKACDIRAEDPIIPFAARICISQRQSTSTDSALMFAYSSGLDPVVEYLIKVEKMGLDSISSSGRTVLAYAAQNGDLDVVRMIIDHAMETRPKNIDCAVPLWVAVVRRHADMVKLLLNRGVDVNLKNRAGVSAILFAAKSGDEKMIELLIHHGADINTIDISGQTALSVAAKSGHQIACKFLVGNGAYAD